MRISDWSSDVCSSDLLECRGPAADELGGAVNRMWSGQAFSVSHADGGAFARDGLRAFFEYRDLGVAQATGGRFGAHVIRAVPGKESPAAWHRHDLAFQRSEEHTSELQSLMRISYAVFCLKKK